MMALRTLSALQGSSMVRWMRRRWLAASADACRLMPVLAASDTIATSFSPRINAAARAYLQQLWLGCGCYTIFYAIY